MTDTNRLVSELQRKAEEGRSVVEILTWLRTELGPGVTFFRFTSCLFLAFHIPVEVLHKVEAWTGFTPAGSLSDSDMEQLLHPFVRRTNQPSG